VAERAEELRHQLDVQRADISRTVEEIENRVVPSRVLNRRRYRMRRSVMDWKDRLLGNDEPDYPSHWYAQPAAPMGAEYGQMYPQDTRYSFSGGGGQGGGMGDARQRAEGAMHEASDRAQGAMHEASDRAQDAMHEAQSRAQGMVQGAQDTMHDVGDRLSNAPQAMRRQTQGNPIALGLVAFGAGLLFGSVMPESRREQELARQAQPKLRHAVEEGKEVAGEVVADLRESAQQSAEELKETATEEAQAFRQEATAEAQATRSDVESVVKE
jgi:ElaB/YqjD/DUF883 family membrane-anchored ribosome-binding protein